MKVEGTNGIGFADSASGDRFFFAVNPAENQQLKTKFVQATPDEVNRAVELAQLAFVSGWHETIALRSALLERCATLAEAYATELMRWYCLETGLSAARAKTELQRSCMQLRLYSEAIRSGYALGLTISTKTASAPDIRKMQVPLGPVVVFGASNFPFAYSVLGGDVASAFAAGCPVIVKGHPMHPHTSEFSARLIRKAVQELQLPEGVFSHLHASDYSVGIQLVQHPLVAAVGFTGSIRGGLALQQVAQQRAVPIPVYAEMGSTNPIVITTGALIERSASIAREIADSIALSAGQFCTSPGLLLVVQTQESERFADELATCLLQQEEQVMLHPDLFEQYSKGVEEQLNGAEVLVAGSRQGNRIRPALVKVTARLFLSELKRREEVFGAFAQLIVCADEAELLACLQQLPGQLTGSLYVAESTTATNLFGQLQRIAGRVVLNGVPTGVTVTAAQQHGGPFPSSSMPASTAVGSDAIRRFSRPVAFQNVPEKLLPEPLKSANPHGFLRFVNGFYTHKAC